MNQIEPKGLVIIIGVLDKEGSTNIPMALSLVRLGFNVIPVNYRTIIGKYGPAFFASFLNNLVINLIAEITRHTKTWIFNMDPKQTIDMAPEVRENARIATFSSCTAMDMVEDWAKVGANCGYIVQGLDEQIFRPRFG
ncbi:MAG: hypothetical protein ACXADW_21045 [Candidatus Hodarchaeales archaeon]